MLSSARAIADTEKIFEIMSNPVVKAQIEGAQTANVDPGKKTVSIMGKATTGLDDERSNVSILQLQKTFLAFFVPLPRQLPKLKHSAQHQRWTRKQREGKRFYPTCRKGLTTGEPLNNGKEACIFIRESAIAVQKSPMSTRR